MKIFLNLGSNLGNREEMLGRAVALLRDALPGRVTCSRMLETPAWGFESAHPFINLGVMIETDTEHEPLGLLHTVQQVQRDLDPSPHRDAEGLYIDRAIDIDIVAIDDVVMDTPELTLPHPRMHLREFVLVPMAELAPEWVHPRLGLRIDEMVTKA
ncbi:MAG: 2-amino-4-hydroxy-6-hydroxymethyldihydropteridine diphosphokinase [Duncaniella sp.]|nr:2-amino-4-hydroxy-6-hydroxymethyldihydropteridine diphosphokinase [Duncaniella sp.]